MAVAAARPLDLALLRDAWRGDVHAVTQHLKAGADPNARDEEGQTALHFAAGVGHASVVHALLEARGTDPNARGEDEWTALHFAAIRGHAAVVDSLLEVLGIDVNVRAKDGDTALHFAALDGHVAIVDALLKTHGIDVNARNKYGDTALHFAANNGHAAVVNSLLKVRGIEINARAKDGDTALHVAANKGHVAVTRALVTAYMARGLALPAGVNWSRVQSVKAGVDRAVLFRVAGIRARTSARLRDRRPMTKSMTNLMTLSRAFDAAPRNLQARIIREILGAC